MIYFEMGFTKETYGRFLDRGNIPQNLTFPPIDYEDMNLFVKILEKITKICAINHTKFFSQNIRDSLALFAIWRSGVSGITQDPSELTSDGRMQQALILLSSTYRNWDIQPSSQYFEMYPTLDELDALMGNGKLLQAMFEYNMDMTHHGDTYGGVALNEVDTFWGNIPEITLDKDKGYDFTGQRLIDCFSPEQINNLFSADEDLKWFYTEKVMPNLPDFIDAERIAHPKTKKRFLRLFPQKSLDGSQLKIHKNEIYNTAFPLWVLAILQVQYSWFLSKSFSTIS